MITQVVRVPAQSFAARFRAMRAESGLSLRQAARLAGISPSFLTDIEHNRRMPSRHHIEKLAKTLGRPAADLLRYDPREAVEEILMHVAERPEIAGALAQICRSAAAGRLNARALERLAVRAHG